MRKIVLTCIVALAVAVPAHAVDGVATVRQLKISGSIVKASEESVSVENRVGDAVLTCAVPERLAKKAAAFKAGDKVRMHCVRHRGRRAQLVTLQRLGDEAKRPEQAKRPEKAAVPKQQAAGPIVKLDDVAIAVQSSEGRLACRVPEEKQAKLDGLQLGDKVKLSCLAGLLVGIDRYEPAEKKPAGEEVRLYGDISELSRASVTVAGEAGSLTCSIPAGLAEKILGRFEVGDSVKLMCRGSELTYLELV